MRIVFWIGQPSICHHWFDHGASLWSKNPIWFEEWLPRCWDACRALADRLCTITRSLDAVGCSLFMSIYSIHLNHVEVWLVNRPGPAPFHCSNLSRISAKQNSNMYSGRVFFVLEKYIHRYPSKALEVQIWKGLICAFQFEMGSQHPAHLGKIQKKSGVLYSVVLLIHLDSWLAYFRYFALSRCEYWWNVCFLDVESLAWLSLLWFTYPGRWRSASSMREKVKIAKLCVKWWRLHDTKQTMHKPTHLCCIGCILLSFLKRSFCFSSRSAVKPLRGTRSNAKRNDTSYGRWGRTWEAFYQQSLKLREGSWQIAITNSSYCPRTRSAHQSELSCKLHHWGLENYSTGDGGHMQKADSCQLRKATRVSSKTWLTWSLTYSKMSLHWRSFRWFR